MFVSSQNQKHVLSHPVHASFLSLKLFFSHAHLLMKCAEINECAFRVTADARGEGILTSHCPCCMNMRYKQFLPVKCHWIGTLFHEEDVHASFCKLHVFLSCYTMWDSPLSPRLSVRLKPITSSIHHSFTANLKPGIHADAVVLCFHKMWPLYFGRKCTFVHFLQFQEEECCNAQLGAHVFQGLITCWRFLVSAKCFKQIIILTCSLKVPSYCGPERSNSNVSQVTS